MPLIRQDIEKMAGYVPGEQPQSGRFIKLNTNENPYPVSEKVRDVVVAEIDRLRLYSDPVSNKLRDEAAKLYGFTPEQVIAGNGSDDILNIIVRMVVEQGGLMASFTPSYTLYQTLAEIQGAEFRLYDFTEDYQIPENLDLSGVKLFFLPNPNSPSGTVISNDDIRKLCKSFEGVLVVDEAYADFAEDNAICLLKEFDNLIVTRTFSKSYSLAGLRVGLGLSSPYIIENMMKVKDSYNLDRFAQMAAAAALSDQEALAENTARIKATRKHLTENLTAMGAYVYPSQANFVLAKFSGNIAKDLYLYLKSKNIFVRYFETDRLKDCLRISVGTDEEIDCLLAVLKEKLA